MKVKPHPYLLLLFLTIISCEELDRPNTEQFVVEGFITADFQIDDIKIKRTVGIADSIIDQAIPDADVRIFSEQEQLQLVYNELTRKYEDPIGTFPILTGQHYRLEIEVDGTVASGASTVPDKPTGLALSDTSLVIPTLFLSFSLRDQIVELFETAVFTLEWDAEPGRSYYVVIQTLEQKIDPIIPVEVPEESKELLSSFRFISEPSEETSFVIRGIALESYGRHVARVYSVNQEYVDLFNSSTQDSRDLNEPPSNIQNGLGIFSAFAVDSLVFEVNRE